MSENVKLPAIREELQLLPGPQTPLGAPEWLIFDPVRNAFFRLSEYALRLLRHWHLINSERVLEAANREPGDPLAQEDIDELLIFLYTNRLIESPAEDDPNTLAKQEKAASPPFWKQVIHRYLFVKIPLFCPDAFLKRAFPFVAPFFTRIAWVIIAAAAILGLYLAVREWEAFVATFLHFLTFEGAIFYGVTLLLIMSAHELGHAFAAHYYRCRVATIGVAFLVMFPILYTDTTDAWRLRDRRQRLAIDVAGMAVELIIASIATLLWSFLPDGPARSAAFFAATTSWTLSLVVNLNPFLRFDGYYILSDLVGFPNLQPRSFALGRWRVRELLFGLGEAPPETFERGKAAALTVYAWSTWIYRFFLFIGIALFVHAFFAKALGIILFVIEIAWFIARPIADEIKVWYSCREGIVKSTRSRLSLLTLCMFLAVLFVPWRTAVKAPAIATPHQQTEIFAQTPGLLTDIVITEGDFVKEGQVLFRLELRDVEEELRRTEIIIDQIEAKLNRRVVDVLDRKDSLVLKRSLLRERDRAEGLRKLIADAELRAPHDGVITDLPRSLNANQWVRSDLLLGRIAEVATYDIIALPNEKDVSRINRASHVKFIPDDILLRPRSGTVREISATALRSIDEPVFASVFGGRVAVREDEKGDLLPESAVFELRAHMHDALDVQKTIPGVAVISAQGEAPIRAIWRRVTGILVREADF